MNTFCGVVGFGIVAPHDDGGSIWDGNVFSGGGILGDDEGCAAGAAIIAESPDCARTDCANALVLVRGARNGIPSVIDGRKLFGSDEGMDCCDCLHLTSGNGIDDDGKGCCGGSMGCCGWN